MAASKRSRNSSIRSVFRHFQLRRSPLDIWLGLFFVTVVFGVWNSYSVQLALVKFWMVVASIGLFYVVTAVSRRYAWWVAAICGPLTAVVAVYFLTADFWSWGLSSAGKFFPPLISILSLKRFWPILVPHPNVVGGLVAMFLPFVIAFWGYARRRNRKDLVWLTAVSFFMALIALILSKSVGAWAALAAGLLVWGLWPVSERLVKRVHLPILMIYSLLLIVAAIMGLSLLLLIIQFQLPGSQSLIQRFALTSGIWRLIQDYSFTGSGLGAFPALYSEYIQIVPNFFVGYGNLYLDVLLELGLFGFIFLFAIWINALWMAIKAIRRSLGRPAEYRGDLYWLRWAAVASLVIMFIHGMTDDVLFGGLGTPFLFFTPAMAVLVSRRQSTHEMSVVSLMQWRSLLVTAVGFLLVAGLMLAFRKDVAAYWYANQGALQMDRVLLNRWPQNEWRSVPYTAVFKPAATKFEQALQNNQENRTAHQRLGMIAYQNRDFETAVQHLNIAFEKDKNHRGNRKILGYSYVWLGQYNVASSLLADIPEAAPELEAYINWWQAQNQAELAHNAQEMVSLLESQN